jgi:type IV secretory pathway VirB3-like protein
MVIFVTENQTKMVLITLSKIRHPGHFVSGMFFVGTNLSIVFLMKRNVTESRNRFTLR